MPTNLECLTPLQRLIVEHALVLAKELEATANSAPAGQVIDRCELLLLGNGRAFLRTALESTIQSQAELLEKKGVPPESARVGRRDGTRENRPKQ
jgi:hypothetical protein